MQIMSHVEETLKIKNKAYLVLYSNKKDTMSKKLRRLKEILRLQNMKNNVLSKS